MDEATITRHITESFAGVEVMTAMGYTFFFHGPDRKMPFATLAAADNEHDRVSNLDRPGVYRLNIGVAKDTYRAMFGPPPPMPGPSEVVNTGHDFTALDQIMPHPVYATQSWVCVLSPGDATLSRVKELLAEAYGLAKARHDRRAPPADAT